MCLSVKKWFGYSTRRLKENPKMASDIIKSYLPQGIVSAKINYVEQLQGRIKICFYFCLIDPNTFL